MSRTLHWLPLLSLCASCAVLELFESHAERTPPKHGTLILKGHLDFPLEVSVDWAYETVPDTRSCRSMYNFATASWQGHHRRFSSKIAKRDNQGNYRLVLDLKVPDEHRRCQWYIVGPKIFIRIPSEESWYYAASPTNDTHAPTHPILQCYVIEGLGAACEPPHVHFFPPDLHGERREMQVDVKLIPNPNRRIGETGFEGLNELLDAGPDRSTPSAPANDR